MLFEIKPQDVAQIFRLGMFAVFYVAIPITIAGYSIVRWIGKFIEIRSRVMGSGKRKAESRPS